ncbi:VanZ family protein [Pontiellaceae bacterium B12227]|nr:VanZ family protein [Pontiellaceae bacterium B12227]
MRLPAILLLAASFFFWENYDPCRPYGPVLFDSAQLADAAMVEGDCSEIDSVLTLTRPPGGTVPSVVFNLPDVSSHRILRLQGRMRVKDVVPGNDDFQGARLKFVKRNKKGRPTGSDEEQIYGAGSFDWKTFRTDTYLHRRIKQVDILLTQQGQSGTVQFDSIEVRPVRLKGRTHWFKIAFGIVWVIFGVIYYPRCRLHTRKLRHLILLNVLLILVGVLLPTRFFQYGIPAIKKMIPFVQVEGHSVSEPFIAAGVGFDLPAHFQLTVAQSYGHFILFGSLCFLVLLSGALEGQPKWYYFKVAFDVLLFGAVTESLQYLTPDRTVDMADLYCNAYGMLTAMVLFIIFKSLWRGPVQWIDGKTS